MKTKITFLLAILLNSIRLHAADIYVNSSGQPGTYTTISAALVAAGSNDKIYISPFATYNENLSIDKSVTLVSSEDSTDYYLNGNITIFTIGALDIRLIGGECNSILFTASSATESNRCKVSIVGTEFGNNLSAPQGVDLNLLYCDIPSQQVTFYYGNVIANSLSTLTIPSGDNSYYADTTNIIANTIGSGSLSISNGDHNFFVANNYFQGTSGANMLVYTATVSGGGGNNIVNNTFTQTSYTTYGSNLKIVHNQNMTNTQVKNNTFQNGYNSSQTAYRRHIGSASSSNQLTTALGPVVSFNHFHSIWGGVYNYTVLPNNVLGGAIPQNEGDPSIQYYDIDLTRNDMGRFGGPYTWDNYHGNTTSGKGRVYLLDMPFELWSGQTPTIKADAVHE